MNYLKNKKFFYFFITYLIFHLLLIKNYPLNFEYSFFKLTKLIITDDSLITNTNDFNSLLKYCLNKSIQQYNLFQTQNLPINTNYLDDFDENDEFNIIEL